MKFQSSTPSAISDYPFGFSMDLNIPSSFSFLKSLETIFPFESKLEPVRSCRFELLNTEKKSLSLQSRSTDEETASASNSSPVREAQLEKAATMGFS
ncbi:hypothetical protein L2E82_49814 [Cichorium intybus]|uniref:Uncharacterized protein n=1 Tax=Cichorium intybus TaxID=13427 RepID=A0ACB8Z2F3_CICIN|nr:hypothetical protein L2E82_49814 [Cichorium intybus]